eukprot:m.251430 g.251430  ORF g.251430 m.251430 type:complete len:3511 (-) comp33895_c0_seq1:293-10825(-)
MFRLVCAAFVVALSFSSIEQTEAGCSSSKCAAQYQWEYDHGCNKASGYGYCSTAKCHCKCFIGFCNNYDHSCTTCKCTAGTATGSNCHLACSACGKGQYRRSSTCTGSASSARTVCDSCAAGKYQSSSSWRSTSCSSCSPGYYASGTRNSACASCTSYHFQDLYSQSAQKWCSGCAWNQRSTAGCNALSVKKSDNQCSPCPSGQYKYTNNVVDTGPWNFPGKGSKHFDTSCSSCTNVLNCQSSKISCTRSYNSVCASNSCNPGYRRSSTGKKCVTTCEIHNLECYPGTCSITSNDGRRQRRLSNTSDDGFLEEETEIEDEHEDEEGQAQEQRQERQIDQIGIKQPLPVTYGRKCTCLRNFEGATCQNIKSASTSDMGIEGWVFVCNSAYGSCVSDPVTYKLDAAGPIYTNQQSATIKVDWKHVWNVGTVPAIPNYADTPGQTGAVYAGLKVGIVEAKVYVGTTQTTSIVWGTGAAATSAAPHPFSPARENKAKFSSGQVSGSDGKTVAVKVRIKNGGQVTVNTNSRNMYINGVYSRRRATTKVYNGVYKEVIRNVVFDFTAPFAQCTDSSCPLTTGVGSLTQSSSLNIKSSGWQDATSGIKQYIFTMCPMVVLGNVISELETSCVTKTRTTPPTTASHLGWSMSSKKMWSIRVRVFDRAGNHREARRVVLYDTSTVAVSTRNGVVLENKVGYNDVIYQVSLTSITFSWAGVFSSTTKNWLLPLKARAGVTSGYDQPSNQPIGKASGTTNIDGIVKFMYRIRTGASNPSWVTKPYSSVTPTKMTLTGFAIGRAMGTGATRLTDGGDYIIDVLACDVFNRCKSKSLAFSVDASDPVLTALSLGRQGEQIAVHNSHDLTKMAVSFAAYDDQSGLKSVTWELAAVKYPSGTEQIVAPTHIAANTADADGGFVIDLVAGLSTQVLDEMKSGLHAREYIFTIIVQNYVGMIADESLTVIVDVTPPTIGVVSDGAGDNDMDYTSNSKIECEWSGFADPESGVRAYYATISNQKLTLPADAAVFTKYASGVSSISKTVSVEGQYWCYVYAVNNALDGSDLVSSDGVKYSLAPPAFDSVTLRGMHMKESVAKHAGFVWKINNNATRTKIASSAQCNSVAAADLSAVGVASPDTTLPSSLCTTLPNFDGIYHTSNANVVRAQWNFSTSLQDIRQVRVGLGTRGDNGVANVLAFQSTDMNVEAVHQVTHAQLRHGSLTFLIVEAVNRNGLRSTSSLGPILVDLTPPQTSTIDIDHITGSSGLAQWAPFVDDEETLRSSAYTVSITQGVHDLAATTLDSADVAACAGGKFCITLPRDALPTTQPYRVKVSACNTAGLCSTSFSEEQTPAKAPYGGAVYDLGDALQTGNVDVDVQTNPTKLAARWFGVAGSKMTYDIGVGTSDSSADVVAFKRVVGTQMVATVTSSSFVAGRTYFLLINATNALGWSVIASDGVRILPVNRALNLKLHTGAGCTGVPLTPVASLDLNASSEVLQVPAVHLRVGSTYQFEGQCNGGGGLAIQLHSASVTTQIEAGNFDAEFTATSDRLELINKGSTKVALSSLGLRECSTDHAVSAGDTYDVAALWKVPSADLSLLPYVHFEWSVQQWINSAFVEITPYSRTTIAQVAADEFTLKSFVGLPAGQYSVFVRACHEAGCYAATKSSFVHVVESPPTPGNLGAIVDEVDEETAKLTISLQGFAVESGALSFYRWSLGTHEDGGEYIQPWTVVHNSETQASTITIEAMVDIETVKLHAGGGLFVTVQGYQGKWFGVTTAAVDMTPMAFAQDKNVGKVFDVVKLPTRDGEVVEDIDYTSRTSKYFGMWPNAWPLLAPDFFKWSLSTERALSWSADGVCDVACGDTRERRVARGGLSLSHGIRYYLCVLPGPTTVSDTDGTPLTVTEYDGNAICSDGVTIDLTAPRKGDVFVGDGLDARAYQSNTDVLAIRWGGFTDGEESELGVHTSGIKSYTVTLGSAPHSSDVWGPVDVGSTTHWIVSNLSLVDGQSYYATVIATDYVGLTAVSASDPIRIDSSPPIAGHIVASVPPTTPEDDDVIVMANWTGFSDLESGIREYRVALGSRPDAADLSPFTSTGSVAHVSIEAPTLVQGHAVYVTVAAINNAGLITTAVSREIIVDTRAPIAGVVVDGATATDVDAQTDATTLTATWTEFVDAETYVTGYEVGVGTQFGHADVRPFSKIGLALSTKLEGLALVDGVVYYVAVRACDAQSNCVVSSTNGVLVDTTVPATGRVLDGFEVEDMDFVPQATAVAASWVDFHDSESGVVEFEWCVGTSAGDCSLFAFTSVGLATTAIKTGVTLPSGQDLFTTVRATNGAGLKATKSSNGFQLNSAAPTVVKGPVLVPYLGVQGRTAQASRSILTATWTITDASPMTYTWIATTGDDDQPPMNSSIAGTSEGGVASALELVDGEVYFAVVTACNAAGVCVQKKSTQGLLVDSSPPLTGTFNAAALSYNAGTKKATFAWTGFYEPHTSNGQVASYRLSVGTSYGAADILRDVSVAGSLSSTVQDIGTRATGARLYIMLRAENAAGVFAEPVHSTVDLRSSGKLQVIDYTCNVFCDAGDGPRCTCGPFGVCVEAPVAACSVDATATVTATLHDGREAGKDTAVQADASVLFATFDLKPSNKYFVQYSASLKGKAAGVDLMNLQEPVWLDAGHATTVEFVASKALPLRQGSTYVVHLRVWTGVDKYKDFQTDGVEIDVTPPQLSSRIRVREVGSQTHNDIDLSASLTAVDVRWDAPEDADALVLFDTAGLKSFEIGVGSQRGSTDVRELKGLEVVGHANLTSLKLTPHHKYYTTVVAHNKAGLTSRATSDGFYVDTSKPMGGTVHAGPRGPGLAMSQQNKNTLSANWAGFFDAETALKEYEWCIGSTAGACNVMKWTSVGLNTDATATGLSLDAGVYFASVKAVNVLGLESDVVSSEAVVVDDTPPVVVGCKLTAMSTNLVRDGSFETVGSTPWQSKGGRRLEDASVSFKGSGSWVLPDEDDDKLSQVLTTTINERYMLEFMVMLNTTHPADRHVMETKIGSTSHAFEITSTLTWSRVAYHFRADSTTTALEFMAMEISRRNHFEVLIDDVRVAACVGDTDVAVDAGGAFQSSTTTVRANWHLDDEESSIVEYMWAIGNVAGGTQLQPFTSVGVASHAEHSRLHLQHNTTVHVSLVARNGAGASATFATSFLVDHTPPTCTKNTLDGDGIVDVDYQSESEISASWESCDDPESGLSECAWSVGTSRGSDDLRSATVVQGKSASATLATQPADGTMIFVSVHCVNGAGLATDSYSDGVRVIASVPDTDDAVVTVTSLSSQVDHVQFPAVDGFVSSQDPTGYSVEVQWSGFGSQTGRIQHYELRLRTQSDTGANWTNVGLRTSTTLKEMPYVTDKQYLDVRAVDPTGRYSLTVTQELSFDANPPFTTSTAALCGRHEQEGLRVDWSGVFKDDTCATSPPQCLRYGTSLGTKRGSGDVVSWLRVNQSNAVFAVPQALDIDQADLYLAITAVNQAGLHITDSFTISASAC